MAARRRNTGSSSRRRKLPGWALLLIGLMIGVGLMIGTQYVFFRAHKPFPGLSNLFAERKPVEEKKKPASPPAQAVKPKFDFYTVLPEIETVLPERGARTERRPAPTTTAATRPEADVRYVLQAASFAQHEDADRLKAKLALSGLEASIEKVTIEGKGDFFRVRLGPYARLEELDAVNQRLATQGIKAMRLKVKPAPGT